MHQTQFKRNRLSSRKAAVLPLIALMLPLLLLFAGFAINVAYMQLCQTEMQISTDVAAKAAGRIYATEQDPVRALAIANEAGALNRVAQAAMVFGESDLVVGNSVLSATSGRYEFTAASASVSGDDDLVGGGSTIANAIELTGRRDPTSSNGAVQTYFPSLVGTGEFSLLTTSVSTQVEVDIAIVLDRSGSMAYASNEPAVYPPIPAAAPTDWFFGDPVPDNSRWLDARISVATFLNDLNSSAMNEQVALVSYADGARIDQNLTFDYSNIITEINNESNDFDGGGTNIAAGLQAGQSALVGSSGRKFAARVVVILTDGRRTVGSSPTYWANQLAESGVMIIAITFSDEADQATMKTVAEIGNGFHIHANDRFDLMDAFKSISRRLPTLLTR